MPKLLKKSIKRKSLKRKSIKCTSLKCKSIKRKSIKRKSLKRKSIKNTTKAKKSIKHKYKNALKLSTKKFIKQKGGMSEYLIKFKNLDTINTNNPNFMFDASNISNIISDDSLERLYNFFDYLLENIVNVKKDEDDEADGVDKADAVFSEEEITDSIYATLIDFIILILKIKNNHSDIDVEILKKEFYENLKAKIQTKFGFKVNTNDVYFNIEINDFEITLIIPEVSDDAYIYAYINDHGNGEHIYPIGGDGGGEGAAADVV